MSLAHVAGLIAVDLDCVIVMCYRRTSAHLSIAQQFAMHLCSSIACNAIIAGTLLGGGGAMGRGGAIAQFVPDHTKRQQLFESVAYDCQINQQPSEAIEMFMAAQKPRAALKIINQQLSAAIHAQQGKHWHDWLDNGAALVK